jgi:RNA polymerase sigma-70 factor (ECF subfamily)
MPVLDSAARSRHDAAWSPLIERAAEGDMECFGRLYDLASPVVYLLAMLVLRDAREAEEATLEAFAEVWRRADEFDPARHAASSWVAKIANERALARRRAAAGSVPTGVAGGRAVPDADAPSHAGPLRAIYVSA